MHALKFNDTRNTDKLCEVFDAQTLNHEFGRWTGEAAVDCGLEIHSPIKLLLPLRELLSFPRKSRLEGMHDAQWKMLRKASRFVGVSLRRNGARIDCLFPAIINQQKLHAGHCQQ